jgi:SpoIIAA-like
MIETIPTDFPKTVGFKLSGRLHDEDYKSFVPIVETLVAKEGKVRMFVKFEDFHGWDLHAAWDDFRFAIKHYADFDRIALVGDRRWEKWMAHVCKPFTKAKLRYFDVAEVDRAWTWLREGIELGQ